VIFSRGEESSLLTMFPKQQKHITTLKLIRGNFYWALETCCFEVPKSNKGEPLEATKNKLHGPKRYYNKIEINDG
jgi:hypothetical protein